MPTPTEKAIAKREEQTRKANAAKAAPKPKKS